MEGIYGITMENWRNMGLLASLLLGFSWDMEWNIRLYDGRELWQYHIEKGALKEGEITTTGCISFRSSIFGALGTCALRYWDHLPSGETKHGLLRKSPNIAQIYNRMIFMAVNYHVWCDLHKGIGGLYKQHHGGVIPGNTPGTLPRAVRMRNRPVVILQCSWPESLQQWVDVYPSGYL